MLRHAFRFVDCVVFFVSPGNLRSRRAVEKIGGVRVGSGLDAAGRCIYRITVSEFARRESGAPERLPWRAGPW